jgi:hypothetical protein
LTLLMSFVAVLAWGSSVPVRALFQNSTVFSHG